MDIKDFVKELNKPKQLNEFVKDIMHPEDINTLSDLDDWQEIINKAWREYQEAGGYYRYKQDFENLLNKMRKKKWYKDRIKTGKDVATEEKKIRERQGKTKSTKPKETKGKGFSVKEKEQPTTSGLKPVKINKIERGKNNLWKIEYEGQEFNLGADAILHMLMKDQKGEVNEYK